MFLVVMLADGSLVTIGTNGSWVPIMWDSQGGPITTNIAAVPDNAVIMVDMLPIGTIDSYLADVTTGLPLLPEILEN